MQGTIGYILNLVIMVTLISSLFWAKPFWSKVAQTHNGAYVRYPLAAWILACQIFWYVTSIQKAIDSGAKNEVLNAWFYWELCNIVAWFAIILLLVPNKLTMELIFPFALIGPILTIVTPTQETAEFTFGDFRYYEYFYGHIASLFSFIFIYLYGMTKFKFGWKFIGKSMLFAWCLLTFVAMWNQFYKIPVDRDSTFDGDKPTYGNFPNYIFRDIFNNIGLGEMPLDQQYFVLTYGIGPSLMLGVYLLMTVVQPLYLNSGKDKQKFKINTEFYINSYKWTKNLFTSTRK